MQRKQNKPCGHHFCAATVRILHGVEDITYKQAGVVMGLCAAHVARLANGLGLAARYENRLKPVSMARIRKLHDQGLRLAEIGAVVGLHGDTVARKQKILGLRAKTKNNYRDHIQWPAQFDAMWRDGVLIADIMAAAKGRLTDVRCVSREAKRRGLPPRNRNCRWTALTINEWRELQLGKAMAVSARAEQAAIIDAEMADAIGHRLFLVGRDHARAAA